MVGQWRVFLCLCAQMLATVIATDASPRCIMYLTGQHDVIPEDAALRQGVTHVILAFMRSEVFNAEQLLDTYPLFTSVDKVRQNFPPTTKVLVAIGGWGNSLGFEDAAQNATTRQHWARQVENMVKATGADGVDLDWEYPGGNRDDYKIITNDQRRWEIDAFQLLLQDLRSALGGSKIISIAVPGLERDLMAFTKETVPTIVEQVDFFNIMTYDLINRRDTIVKHHSGISDSKASIQRYLDRGLPRSMANLGLGYYVKWVMTENCDPENVLSCRTQLLENPEDGGDMGKTAAFSWHDEIPDELASSFTRAVNDGQYFEDGSYGYWDGQDQRWWTFDTPTVIRQKIQELVGSMELGGVFAWGLGEDAPVFSRLEATLQGTDAVRISRHASKDEL